jgi:exopolyphosphatase/guanosine-5'-triphosphate,3'-diphosphate pyrophosphatase
MILAGIDIGTNTARLLIADVGAGSFREIESGRIVTRLGQDLDRTGTLAATAQERTLQALEEFSRRIAGRGIAVSVVGTSALRIAGNTAEFIGAVKARTGLDVRVVSGESEAQLTLLGVRQALSQGTVGHTDPLFSSVVVDIGGGSTELIATSAGTVERSQSLPLGAVYLTERFIKCNPPSAAELDDLRSTVRNHLDAWAADLLRDRQIHVDGLDVFAGTAGTITTLAAMDQRLDHYDPARINGYVIKRSSLYHLVKVLSLSTLEERRSFPGLEVGREDIILAGAIICCEIMRLCGNRDLLVSDWGLREGIVLDLYERMTTA